MAFNMDPENHWLVEGKTHLPRGHCQGRELTRVRVVTTTSSESAVEHRASLHPIACSSLGPAAAIRAMESMEATWMVVAVASYMICVYSMGTTGPLTALAALRSKEVENQEQSGVGTERLTKSIDWPSWFSQRPFELKNCDRNATMFSCTKLSQTPAFELVEQRLERQTSRQEVTVSTGSIYKCT